jgi:hypothetical protein
VDAASHKEVVITALGAAATLAGLVLVFEGVIVTALQSFPGGTDPVILRGYRRGAWAGLGGFIVSLATVAAAFIWLLLDCDGWYVATVVLFAGQLIGIFGVAVYVTRELMG